jgi:hypothetical protein
MLFSESAGWKCELFSVQSKIGGQSACYPVIAEIPDIHATQLPPPMGLTSVEVVEFSQAKLQPLNTSTNFTVKASIHQITLSLQYQTMQPHVTSRNGTIGEAH